VELRRLQERDDRTQFNCGDPALNDFFRSRAGQNQFRYHAAVTYVLLESAAILGFVTVLPGTVRRDDLGPAHRRLPPSALPVLVLARMGVRTDRHRAGLGGRLLAKVCELALDLSRDVGCVGVVVDAKEAASGFYERHDFIWLLAPVTDGIRRGFLPIQTIAAALTL
jgi:GNAT superfamily N-acetyltransferase